MTHVAMLITFSSQLPLRKATNSLFLFVVCLLRVYYSVSCSQLWGFTSTIILLSFFSGVHVKTTSRFRHSGLKLVRFVLQSTSIYLSNFFVVLFLCLSCRFGHPYHYVHCRLKQRQKAEWNMKPIKWERAKPASTFCSRLLHVQINSRADIFW